MLPAKPGHLVGTIGLKIVVLLFPIALLVVLSEPNARAVPSYSRQTGLPCASCHYAPPELNAFGRQFKLDGYTFTTKPEVSDDKKDHNSGLHILEAFPLSLPKARPSSRRSHATRATAIVAWARPRPLL
jgi:hypothetical protein